MDFFASSGCIQRDYSLLNLPSHPIASQSLSSPGGPSIQARRIPKFHRYFRRHFIAPINLLCKNPTNAAT